MIKLEGFTEEETIAYAWQYGMLGSFHESLMQTIAKADTFNIIRLARSFPAEVKAYTLYTTKEGWWTDVVKRMKERGIIKEMK